MRKKEIKRLSIKTIVITVIVIFFLSISIGYSYLKQSLKIEGKSTIAPTIIEGYIQGNSIYNLEIIDSTENLETNEKNVRVRINIINRDKDISNLKVSFDVPKSYNDVNSFVINNNYYKTFENGRIILTSKNNNFIAKGDSIQIELQLSMENSEKFYIDNLVINDLLAKSK